MGSIFGVKIFNMMHPKYILIIALIIAGVFSWAFTQTKVFELLVLIRFMSGFSQSFVSIFLPVWADRYAPSEGAKQCWLSGVLMSSTIGVLFGYVITAAFITHLNWHWSFYFQSVCILPVLLLLIITPKKYLDITAPVEPKAVKETDAPEVSLDENEDILVDSQQGENQDL